MLNWWEIFQRRFGTKMASILQNFQGHPPPQAILKAIRATVGWIWLAPWLPSQERGSRKESRVRFVRLLHYSYDPLSFIVDSGRVTIFYCKLVNLWFTLCWESTDADPEQTCHQPPRYFHHCRVGIPVCSSGKSLGRVQRVHLRRYVFRKVAHAQALFRQQHVRKQLSGVVREIAMDVCKFHCAPFL